MLNKILAFIRQMDMIRPDDHVICAVSGGADSVALLFAMYLLKDKLGFRLSAAHFNHHLRGEESNRDEVFVREFCHRYDIPLYLGGGEIVPAGKGLEAAARDARYAFLRSLPGKIATAHTADDNAETILLHLVRGTGLKGLGGITPVSDRVIRPMLGCTRQNVEAFLEEWCLHYVEDSSNLGDDFLRNRLRHSVMPLLRRENPKLAENLSAMALRLRRDEECLTELAAEQTEMDVETLKAMRPALRSRVLERFLKESGVREPEAAHIAQAEALLFSDKPSARAVFPGSVTVGRQYDRLVRLDTAEELSTVLLNCPGVTELPQWGLRVICEPARTMEAACDTFPVCPEGQMVLRPRQAGDAIRLSGGSKSLKKLFIDRKIPASQRDRLPVIADEAGILGVYGIGVNLDRRAESLPAVRIKIEKKK